MTFQAISRAQNLHTARYMAGQHFHNGHGGQVYSFSRCFGAQNLEKIGRAPLQGFVIMFKKASIKDHLKIVTLDMLLL